MRVACAVPFNAISVFPSPVRLHSIKLAGFKSFAEPTTFLLPGQMVGVVGPNGCGKSNIMDAVRWVLGESKASELRGESMQDVIFSGTHSRKPASRASVELVFNNEDGQRAGGQWAQYSEIAVKRILTRDGNSSYHINGQQVRRKDVQDVFMGTGLGPRAYAIIGQGTISKIIESKPEELRLFLEEAAGVSKYKERRRETENRLEDTRDNLTRLHDILGELGSSLKKLQIQAEVAQRYSQLQQHHDSRQQQLWLLRQTQAQRDLEQAQASGQQAITALQEQTATMDEAHAALEHLREQHQHTGENLNEAQRALYETTARVGKLEAEIRFATEGRQRLAERLQGLAQQQQHWHTQAEQAQAQAQQLEEDSAQAEAHSDMLEAQLEEHSAQMPDWEQHWQQQQRHGEQHRQQLQQVQQQLQILKTEQRGARESQQQLQQRLERIRQERQNLHPVDEAHLHQQQQALAEAGQEAECAQAAWQELQEKLPELDTARRDAQQQVQHTHAEHTRLEARRNALRALQEKVQHQGKHTAWLKTHGLDGTPPLWTLLQVDTGWEHAVEAVLRERIAALPVQRLELAPGLAGGEPQTPPVRLAFYAPAATDATADTPIHPGLRPLADKVRSSDPHLQRMVQHWLHGCHASDSLAQALAQRQHLQSGEQILSPQGHSVTASSLSFYAQDSEQSGMLARAQEIELLERQCADLAQTLHSQRAQLQQADTAHQQASGQLRQQQQAADQAQKTAHQLQVDVLRLNQQASQTRASQSRLDADETELRDSLESVQAAQFDTEARASELEAQLEELQSAQASQQAEHQRAEQTLQRAREQLRQLEREAQQARFAQQQLHSRRAELQRTLHIAHQQLHTLAEQQQAAEQEQQHYRQHQPQQDLDAAQAQQQQHEQTLERVRRDYDSQGRQLRQAEESRQRLERTLEPLRQAITEARLQEQAAQLAWQQMEEQLQQAEADKAQVQAGIARDGVQLEGLQAEIDRTQRQIQALGPVNLAALQELQEAQERQEFLSAQVQDLTTAMHTLEEAIRTIDAETRELLTHTFETVNRHFGEMFPELFGGGQARLTMTGDEILHAGIQVMAQPPGKRNQTIHLLSGGEKALTAIALVFAIFQLNPAPFCLLDEVDAPLDDSNTERYARLVARMSAHTQFLYISHNKIAMEMAEQLIGVTMQERGVSRIVAVDMQNALDMVDA